MFATPKHTFRCIEHNQEKHTCRIVLNIETNIVYFFDLTEWKCIFVVWRWTCLHWFLFLCYSSNRRSSQIPCTACFPCPEDKLYSLYRSCIICSICCILHNEIFCLIVKNSWWKKIEISCVGSLVPVFQLLHIHFTESFVIKLCS